ncbi:WhiB family transcriptional regulator [Pseudonocardia petroleophila]|uniref:WhiB family transcriptional regulator n=1 Tax=Pseudonocardia petroleophila TaxID=37331 RepID=A0A7G7MBM1_9PSEU|nr:WhiB family transcriptional regulator [Pseudonocardia petroleophila]QNG50182.1 WhiB family transcriptional regulator [Pseudonocardia petroleophila]
MDHGRHLVGGQHGGRARRVERARGVCADCPVTVECLTDAELTADGWAVRAGTTPAQRAHLVRAARVPGARRRDVVINGAERNDHAWPRPR